MDRRAKTIILELAKTMVTNSKNLDIFGIKDRINKYSHWEMLEYPKNIALKDLVYVLRKRFSSINTNDLGSHNYFQNILEDTNFNIEDILVLSWRTGIYQRIRKRGEKISPLFGGKFHTIKIKKEEKIYRIPPSIEGSWYGFYNEKRLNNIIHTIA